MKCAETNAMLDLWMDDALDPERIQELEAHGCVCPDCAKQIQATRQLKAILNEAEPEADVPLQAQARWRNEVRKAASMRSKRRFYQFGGAAAAVLVLIAGVGMFFNGDMRLNAPGTARSVSAVTEEAVSDADSAIAAKSEEFADEVFELTEENSAPFAAAADSAYVEADGGEPELPAMAAGASDSAVPHLAFDLSVENLDAACTAIRDLVSEYEGSAEEQRFEEDGVNTANLYVMLPAGNCGDFLSSIAYLDLSNSVDAEVDLSDSESASLVIVLKQQAE